MTDDEDKQGEQFAARVARLARAVPGIASAGPIEGEAHGVVLQIGDGGVEARIDVEGLEGELGDAPEAEQDERIQRFIAGLVTANSAPPPWDQAQERVFLVLRPHRFFFTLAEDVRVLVRRSLPGLVECVALDRGESLTYVTEGMASGWGISPDDLFEVARENVETRLEHQLVPIPGDDPPTIFHIASTDAYESSRLVSLPWLAKAREALETDALICAAPHRDLLILARDVSPPTLLRLAELAESEFRASSRGISPALYVFTPDGDLGPLELVDEHPLHQRIRRGHVLLADAEYDAQKAVLEQRIAAAEMQLGVASHFAVEREGQVFAYATWSEEMAVLLPIVDLVAFSFADPERPPLLVPWGAVEAIAGELWEDVPDLDPPRKRVKGFPGPERLQALAEHAIEL